MLDILDKRKAHEQSIETANKNVMSASALAILLDERKTLQRPEFEALAKEYGIDVEIVDDLARVLNTPSVTSVRTRKEELDEVQVVSALFLLTIAWTLRAASRRDGLTHHRMSQPGLVVVKRKFKTTRLTSCFEPSSLLKRTHHVLHETNLLFVMT